MKTEKSHQHVPLAPPPHLETGGVIFFLIQNHQKVSRTLGFVASASPLFIWTSGPLSRSPFLPFFFFAPPPPLSLRQSAPFGVGGGGGAGIVCWAKWRERKNGKGCLGKRKKVAGSMVGWLGDNGGEGGGWEWRYLVPCSYYFLPALSVRLSQQVFFLFILSTKTPTYFLCGLCGFAAQADYITRVGHVCGSVIGYQTRIEGLFLSCCGLLQRWVIAKWVSFNWMPCFLLCYLVLFLFSCFLVLLCFVR